MRSFRFALSAPVLAVLATLACSGPSGHELFAKSSVTSAGDGGAGGSSAAVSGTGSTPNQNQAQGGTSEAVAGSSSAGTQSGGSGGSSVAGTPSGGSGGNGGQVTIPPVLESCDMLVDAVSNDDNGHCYRINSDKLTFTGAREACAASAGHLVTISSEAEDDFVHELLDDAHWLGATDGRGNGMEGVAPYTWVNGDEWDYTNWESGQPNAVATNCPNEGSGANCFEHCAYQDDSGGWNDRACWHTIASICEWELSDLQ